MQTVALTGAGMIGEIVRMPEQSMGNASKPIEVKQVVMLLENEMELMLDTLAAAYRNMSEG